MKRTLAFALVALLFGNTAAQTPYTHRQSFLDAERCARVFDDPARGAWQKPE